MFKSLSHLENDIVFLGNCITFWGEWQELVGSSNKKNRGIPGDTTFGVLERLDEIIGGNPSKVFIPIGVNDLAKNIPDSDLFEVIDLYKTFSDENGKLKEAFTWDGIHLNLNGYLHWISILKNGEYL